MRRPILRAPMNRALRLSGIIESIDKLISQLDPVTEPEIIEAFNQAKAQVEANIKACKDEHHQAIINNLRPNAEIRTISENPKIVVIR